MEDFYKQCNELEEQLRKDLDKAYEEMSCREMIMSCLTYGDNIYANKYVMNYIDILGEQRVFELCKEQEEYFNTKCKVMKNVYTDSEGLTYNSLIEE